MQRKNLRQFALFEVLSIRIMSFIRELYRFMRYNKRDRWDIVDKNASTNIERVSYIQ